MYHHLQVRREKNGPQCSLLVESCQKQTWKYVHGAKLKKLQKPKNKKPVSPEAILQAIGKESIEHRTVSICEYTSTMIV